jgi:hypothetical protein
MLLGAFFDVPNLKEVAARFAGLDHRRRYLASRVRACSDNDGGRVASAFPGDGVGGCGHAVGVDLEEETEAQEGQGVLVPQGARTSQTIRADNASKVPVSYEPRRLASNGASVRIREVERQGGQGSG